MSSQSLADFEALMREVAREMLESAAGLGEESAWDTISLDVRFAADGNSWIDKARVHIGGRPTTALEMSSDFTYRLIKLDAVRRSAFADVWFGLKLSVDRANRVNVEFDYDPTCAEDPSFYDD